MNASIPWRRKMLGEHVGSGDQPVLHVARCFDPILDRVVLHLDRFGCARRQIVQCTQVLEVDTVAGADPWRHLADAAQARCEGEAVLFDPRDARHSEQRRFRR
jgi:hypothetical protein